MKKIVSFSLICAALLHGSEIDLAPIAVESTKISDVSGEEIKSADLAEALTKNVPSVSLVRRSGIANDVILRGQKKDNINILTDDAKVYGACPNRMDPATSHVLANNVESIEIIEGPYDIENFGTLSGAVKITTKKPTEEFGGEVSLNAGSWGYRKGAATVSGGSEKLKLLVSASKESSGQYEDGDGNTLSEQLANATAANTRYQDIYKDMDAYEKKTLMGKLYVDVTQNQELQLSYTANRSDNVLYPSSKMDALWDDSDIFNVGYTLKNLGDYSKALSLQYYNSKVDHPMSTKYRISATTMMGEMTSALTTRMQGLKLKNSFELSDSATVTAGIDASKRNWDGSYYKNGALHVNPTSIDDVDTKNRALFAELENTYSKVNVKIGLRYDDTSITPSGAQQENDYSALSANIFATYHANESTKYFGGFGKSARVPDARELYFTGMMGNEAGTPTLNQTKNYEVDLGVEKRYESATLKTKLFYSKLKDYIYYNADNTTMIMMNPYAYHAFENIDATIYGLSISGSYFATDEVYLDFGLACQRGQKDEALAGQSDKDLAEIPPLKANVALNYDYAALSSAKIEVIAADNWSRYDSDNGEQALAGYAIVNLKANYAFTNSFDLTVGVDNVFDKTYAVSNTYNDLTLIAADAGEVMLLNEPGRYLYVNATYSF